MTSILPRLSVPVILTRVMRARCRRSSSAVSSGERRRPGLPVSRRVPAASSVARSGLPTLRQQHHRRERGRRAQPGRRRERDGGHEAGVDHHGARENGMDSGEGSESAPDSRLYGQPREGPGHHAEQEDLQDALDGEDCPSYRLKCGARISFQVSTGWAPTTRRPLTMKVGVASTWSRSPSAWSAATSLAVSAFSMHDP